MDELKVAVASNLIKLRTEKGMTQAELGERLHYSDKSVSKWERAESIPDAFVLKSIAELFGVTVDYLLSSHDEWEKPKKAGEEKVEYSRSFIILCTVAGIWTLCVIQFVILWILGSVQWITFVAAVPLTLIVLLVFNSVWYHGKHNMYIVGALVLSILVLLYLFLLKYNLWQLFLIAVPAELVVYLSFHIRKRKKHPNSTNRRAQKGAEGEA